ARRVKCLRGRTGLASADLLLCMGLFCIFLGREFAPSRAGLQASHFEPPSRRAPPSPGSPVAGVLREIAVRGLFADVVLLVVAMALGGVEGNVGLAAGALVAPVVHGNGRDGLRRLRHSTTPWVTRENDRRAGIVPRV